MRLEIVYNLFYKIFRILDMKRHKKTIAYIGGTFDLMHHGHVALFKAAKKLADFVVVSLNTDEFNMEYKGRKPVMTLRERIAVVSSCRYVDKVDINEGGHDSKSAILRNKPDYIFHGDDWVRGEVFLKQLQIDKNFLKKHKIKIRYVPLIQGISTTELRTRTKTIPESKKPQLYKTAKNLKPRKKAHSK